MTSFTFIFICICFTLIAVMIFLGERLHRSEIEEVHSMYQEERKALLDRIMANNIHEYKAASGQNNVKKSETGNFLKDRMNQAAKQYQDLE